MSERIEKKELMPSVKSQLKKCLQLPAQILIVLWGWAQCINFLRFYFVREFMLSYNTVKLLQYVTNGMVLLVLLFTVYYLWMHRGWFKQQLAKQLLTVWIVWILSMVCTNLMLANVLHTVVFELQHVLFMLLTSIAILFTGILVGSRPMRLGALAFALLSFAASYFALKHQMALEAIGWMLAFALPGHAMLRAQSNVD